jgi:hypothetical protein
MLSDGRILERRSKQEYVTWIKSQSCEWMHVVIHCIPPNSVGLGTLQNGPLIKALKWTNCSIDRKLGVGSHRLRKIAIWGGDKSIGVVPHVHMMIEKPEAGAIEYKNLFRQRFKDNASKAFRSRTIAPKVEVFEVREADFIEGREVGNSLDKLVRYVLRPEDEKYGSGNDKVIDKACYLTSV